MKLYNKNPRKISAETLAKLRENIKELGDLSGITHDLNTDEIITGNQRSSIIDINNCEKVIIETFDTPTKEGTVSWGFIIWNNQKLLYRQVRWNNEQREKACITANSLIGEWDIDLLSLWDNDLLEEWEVKLVDKFESDFNFNIKSNENRDSNSKSIRCVCPNCGIEFEI